MAQIVNLDELVGGDLVFQYEGTELKIPGDVHTEKVFEIFEAFKQLGDVSVEGDPEKVMAANRLIADELLKLFQIRQPDMERLPFGIKTLPVVIKEILGLLGVNVREDEDGAPLASTRPTTRKPTNPAARKKARGKKSPRSRG